MATFLEGRGVKLAATIDDDRRIEVFGPQAEL
jgi:hypothetical protein